MGNLPPLAIAGIVVGSVAGVCIVGVCLAQYLPDRHQNDHSDRGISFRRSSASTAATEDEGLIA